MNSSEESGWTLYLEQSFPSNRRPKRNQVFHSSEEDEQNNYSIKSSELEEEEEEDLSMVSDASSGPPHFNEDHQTYFNYNDNPCTNKRQKERTISKKKHNQEMLARSNSFLDDTASSPAFNFSKNSYGLADNNSSMNQALMESMLDYSQGFSATHFQGRSAYQDHVGNFVQPPLSENQYNNQWF